MKNIDYDKYLAGLGDFETNQQNQIKKYLEEQCEKDEALRALYRPEKIKDCYDFIMNNVVRKCATDNTACIEEGVVYKMARDFFLEILPTVAETPPEVSAATEKTVAMPDQEENRGEKEEEAEDVVEVESCAMPEEVVQEMNADAQEDKTVRDEYGFEIFGEEAEEPEQEEEPAETPEEADEVLYDEEGQGLLFGF